MKEIKIISFIVLMWLLIIAGGGLLILTSLISIEGFITVGSSRLYYASIVKSIIAIILVVIWIFILLKMKNWMFKKQIRH